MVCSSQYTEFALLPRPQNLKSSSVGSPIGHLHIFSVSIRIFIGSPSELTAGSGAERGLRFSENLSFKSKFEEKLENGKQPPLAHSALAVGEAR